MDRADAGGRGFFGAEGAGESKYAVSHVVGKGSYGVVWCVTPAQVADLGRVYLHVLSWVVYSAAQNRQTQEKVAIKHIDRVLADKADTIRIIRELRFLRLLQHPNIIAVRDVLLPSQRTVFDSIYIVFELLDTDLSHLIRSKTKYDEVHIQVRCHTFCLATSNANPSLSQWLLYQLFAGLRHIHAANVFHRDLKPGNILVNANCDLKVRRRHAHLLSAGPRFDENLSSASSDASGVDLRLRPCTSRLCGGKQAHGVLDGLRCNTVRQQPLVPTGSLSLVPSCGFSPAVFSKLGLKTDGIEHRN
jgi:serine/threonine protein kinase